jgi:hypothetical protein
VWGKTPGIVGLGPSPAPWPAAPRLLAHDTQPDAAAAAALGLTLCAITTSRGTVVDEDALLRALREGRLAGAGLDVFAQEPVRDLAPVQLPNVVATPHVASHTVETLTRMETSCAEAVLAALRGERPRHIVNPESHDRRSTTPNSGRGDPRERFHCRGWL